MECDAPAYFSGLSGFRQLFRTGLPILTYHKLGPRPCGVRLKGLYLSGQLFGRQLDELKSAGYQSTSLSSWNVASPAARVIITFDDGYLNVLQHGLAPLANVSFTAIQFLPANMLGRTNEWDADQGERPERIMDIGQVREWLAAGHEIGSHTLSHPFLTRLPPGQAKEEVSSSRKKLEDLFGRAIEHFCYPYGDWNPAVRELVQESGYKTACTTDRGVNSPNESPYGLKRFMARYPSRNLSSFLAWFRGFLKTRR